MRFDIIDFREATRKIVYFGENKCVVYSGFDSDPFAYGITTALPIEFESISNGRVKSMQMKDIHDASTTCDELELNVAESVFILTCAVNHGKEV